MTDSEEVLRMFLDVLWQSFPQKTSPNHVGYPLTGGGSFSDALIAGWSSQKHVGAV